MRAELCLTGRALKSVSARLPKNLTDFEVLFKLFIKKLQPVHDQVRGVEVGIAGVVSGHRVLGCRNIPWFRKYDFRRLVPKKYKLVVDNDARMFLRQQLSSGAAGRAKRVLALTIGTGIGRAYAENGRVKKIKAFEHAETWEREYQRLRFRSPKFLAIFLAKKFKPIIKKYQPEVIILGGGVLAKKRGLRPLLKSVIKL